MNKYIKKPLCYSAISALLLTETSIASVYELVKGDGNVKLEGVFVDDGKIKVKGETGFENLVKSLHNDSETPDYNILPANLKAGNRVGISDTIENGILKHIESPKDGYNTVEPNKVNQDTTAKLQKDPVNGFYGFDEQMLGAAVFWRDTPGSEAQVYVAKKIPYSLGANKNFYTEYGYVDTNAVTTGYGTPESFKARTDVDHTERQLVAAILAEKGLNDSSSGTMCIYTSAAPCQNKAQSGDNGDGPCVEYYGKLAKAYPKITFKVYFRRFDNISRIAYTSMEKLTKAGYNYTSVNFNELGNKMQSMLDLAKSEIPTELPSTLSTIDSKVKNFEKHVHAFCQLYDMHHYLTSGTTTGELSTEKIDGYSKNNWENTTGKKAVNIGQCQNNIIRDYTMNFSTLLENKIWFNASDRTSTFNTLFLDASGRPTYRCID